MTEAPEHLRVALADRYELQHELGRGGMATVYLAQDLRHPRRVALKVLHAEVAAALGPGALPPGDRARFAAQPPQHPSPARFGRGRRVPLLHNAVGGSKPALKQILGELPLTAEAYWYLRQYGRPLTAHFSLEKLKILLPEWRTQAETFNQQAPHGKQVFIFASLRYWIEHAALVGVSLAGLGHRVTMSYLPYAEWQQPIERFNLRRHNIYALDVLKRAEPLLQILPLLTSKKTASLPEELAQAIQLVSLRDTQYTLQVEDVDSNSDLYRLRWNATKKLPAPPWPG